VLVEPVEFFVQFVAVFVLLVKFAERVEFVQFVKQREFVFVVRE
jgi:hypothetical protein